MLRIEKNIKCKPLIVRISDFAVSPRFKSVLISLPICVLLSLDLFTICPHLSGIETKYIWTSQHHPLNEWHWRIGSGLWPWAFRSDSSSLYICSYRVTSVRMVRTAVSVSWFSHIWEVIWCWNDMTLSLHRSSLCQVVSASSPLTLTHYGT